MLFPADSELNLLPEDGVVRYFGPVVSAAEADRFLHVLLNDLPWQQDEIVMFGKPITTARKVAWYGDGNFAYTYSGRTKRALPWTTELLELKQLVEKLTQTTYNSCLLNLYHHGQEGMGWHSDDEKTLAPEGEIASLSFGAERKFSFKHKRTAATTAVQLEHGSLLLMAGATQTHWLHSLPKTTKVTTPRVNLTFRRFLLP